MGQTCPNCDRHCPVENLRCGRGREYFGVSEPSDDNRREHRHPIHEGRSGYEHRHGHEQRENEPKAIGLLRRCGHLLHHGMGDPSALVDSLTDRELDTLERLLEKCLNNTRR